MSIKTKHLCIIIPAYNEAEKLDLEAYKAFLATNDLVHILFVNDASTDNTLGIIEPLKIEFRNQVDCISNSKNLGKGGSVQAGMLYALSNIPAAKYAFLDADLATSLQECLAVANTIEQKIIFSFASRIHTLNSDIQRTLFRHLSGRIVSTAISKVMNLSVYDTQCGCKVFRSDLVGKIFQEKFISKWLFDVELFFRIIELSGRKKLKIKMLEYPIKKWADKGDSKVKMTYFFKLWLDLWKIKARYSKV